MEGRGSQVKEQHPFQINQKAEFLKHHHLVIIPIVSPLRKIWKDLGWRGVFWGQLLQRELSPVREAQNRFSISQSMFLVLINMNLQNHLRPIEKLDPHRQDRVPTSCASFPCGIPPGVTVGGLPQLRANTGTRLTSVDLIQIPHSFTKLPFLFRDPVQAPKCTGLLESVGSSH